MQQLVDQSFKDLRELYEQVPTENRFLWIDPVLIEHYQFHSVETIKNEKIMKIDNKMPLSNLSNDCAIVIIARNHLMAKVTSNIKETLRRYQNVKFYLFAAPRLYEYNDNLMRDNGVLDYVNYEPFGQFYYQSYDQNCYVMDIPTQVFAGTMGPAGLHAEALLQIIQQLGGARQYTAKGAQACQCLRIFERLQKQQSQTASATTYFSHVVVLSRACDLCSFLLGGQTYAEQIASLQFDRHGRIGNDLVVDVAFQDFKHLNIQLIGEKIQTMVQQAKEIQQQVEEMQQKYNTASMQQIAELAMKNKRSEKTMEKIKKHIQYAKDINLQRDVLYAEQYMLQSDICRNKAKLEQILQYIYNNQIVITQAVQLLCLYGLFHGYRDKKDLSSVKKCLVYQYGGLGEMCYTRISQQGYFSYQNSKQFQELVKQYQIVEQDDQQIDQNKLSSVYNIISPLSVKIVENLITNKGGEGRKSKFVEDGLDTYSLKGEGEAEQNNVLVLMVGPTTHAEIAGFELLHKHCDELIVCSESCLSGTEIVRQMCDMQ